MQEFPEGLDRGDVVTISSSRGHPTAEFPPRFDGACQVLAGIARNGIALQPNGALVVGLLEHLQHPAHIETAAVERLDQAVPRQLLVLPPSAPLMLTQNR